MRRVVISGIGLLTGLGQGVEPTWEALLAGRSAVGPVTTFDATTLGCGLAAEIPGFDPLDFVDRRALKLMTRNDQLAVAGAALAVADAGFGPDDLRTERAGVFVGGNKELSNPASIRSGALDQCTAGGDVDLHWLGRTASSNFHPLFYVEALQPASLFHISNAFGPLGPNCYFVGTADAGATAIGRAYRSIRRGEADVAVAGGFDDAASAWTMAKLDALGVLSDRTERGAAAFRPYDRDRRGFVPGEGSAFVVVETSDSCRRRGGRPYAEIDGFGSAFDTAALVTPRPDGRPLAVAVRAALREAGVTPDEVAYVASHGSATKRGDSSEAAALRAAFSSTSSPVPASSVKPATGHLVAAAGALNVAVSALAIHHSAVPATLHLTDPDPSCLHESFEWVAGDARSLRVGRAVALARGLEGQNVALALRPPPTSGDA
jgi:3-oxoacyl-[acyl-carrier-protein] synthase II